MLVFITFPIDQKLCITSLFPILSCILLHCSLMLDHLFPILSEHLVSLYCSFRFLLTMLFFYQLVSSELLFLSVIYKSTCLENYIPVMMPPLNHTSPPSMVATFLATHLMAVLQPSGYSIFHGRDTPIQLSLPWQSYSYQCLNTETSAWGNGSITTKTLSISYIFYLYIRLVVTL